MALELSKVKRLLQDHLQEGLLIVVGTGLSIAEGVPGMGPLAEQLKSVFLQRKTIDEADLYEEPFLNFGANAVKRLFTDTEIEELMSLNKKARCLTW